VHMSVVNCIFSPGTSTDVTETALALPTSSAADPLPTWLLKQNAVVLALFVSHLFSWSLYDGTVSSLMKSAYSVLIQKKADVNLSGVKSYRSFSNLFVVLKLLEGLVHYLHDDRLLPDRESVSRAFHSMLRVLSDILLALDPGNLAVLMLLDFLAALDSVDHATLLR